LYAHVAAHNTGSIRVLQKCGFHRDRIQEAQSPEPDDGIEEFIFVLAEQDGSPGQATGSPSSR